MKKEKIQEILRLHKMWLNKEEGGRKANFRDADLQGANLQNTDLQGVSMRKANLQYANFRGANMQHTALDYANIHGATGIHRFSKESGRKCYAVEHAETLMIQAGCFWGTLDEFEAACKEKYPNNAVEAYEKQIKELRKLWERL